MKYLSIPEIYKLDLLKDEEMRRDSFSRIVRRGDVPSVNAGAGLVRRYPKIEINDLNKFRIKRGLTPLTPSLIAQLSSDASNLMLE